jgi:DNA polymerase/3'-5' exonuclease PolX
MSKVERNKRVSLVDARKIAWKVLEELSPHCSRIEIAGSIRRQKTDIGDIEIVAIPLPYNIGLMEDGLAKVVNKWEKIKGELKFGESKYTQRILPEGMTLDLFFAKEDNWGYTLALRTGSADYSHKVLASGWVRRGFKSIDGYLWKDGKRYEVKEEKDLFDIVGIPYTEPEKRIA